MPQNQENGAEASEFGHKTAALIAGKIGADKLTSNSNEFKWNGKRVTIRIARQRNNQVGVLYAMLNRVEAVIGAFEITPNEYELMALPPDAFKKNLRDSATGKGRVGLVRKKVFVEKGSFLAKVSCQGLLTLT
jgi:hypothetical protein